MLFQLRTVLSMMLIGLIVAAEQGLYQMETKYGNITMDDGGWAKPVDPQFKATLFKDVKHDNHMYIRVMSGQYKGHFLGGDYHKGIGAWSKWQDAGYMTWNDCILTSKSGFTTDLPITYGPNGYFYFYVAGRNYQTVCVKKVYINQPSKSSVKDDKPTNNVKVDPSTSTVKADAPKGSVKEDPAKPTINLVVNVKHN